MIYLEINKSEKSVAIFYDNTFCCVLYYNYIFFDYEIKEVRLQYAIGEHSAIIYYDYMYYCEDNKNIVNNELRKKKLEYLKAKGKSRN